MLVEMTEITYKNKSLKITFTLHEIKQLVIDNIKETHNIKNGFCLSKCKQGT